MAGFSLRSISQNPDLNKVPLNRGLLRKGEGVLAPR